MAELQPCPFCGGEPVHEETMDEDLWSHNIVPYRRVQCRQCEMGTHYVCDGFEPTEVEQWNRRATDGRRAGAPEGWKLAPIEPTPEIMAGAALAVLNTAAAADLDLARRAARIVLEKLTTPTGLTADMLAASIATMAPAYRAMLAAAPTPPAGDAGQEQMEAALRTIAEWPITPAGNMDAENMRQVARAAIAASAGAQE